MKENNPILFLYGYESHYDCIANHITNRYGSLWSESAGAFSAITTMTLEALVCYHSFIKVTRPYFWCEHNMEQETNTHAHDIAIIKVASDMVD